MSASIVARTETSFTVQVEIPYGSSMLDFEQAIQDRLNQAGVPATRGALHQFDTDCSPITIRSVKFTSKGPCLRRGFKPKKTNSDLIEPMQSVPPISHGIAA